jgi:hypothetical protein
MSIYNIFLTILIIFLFTSPTLSIIDKDNNSTTFRRDFKSKSPHLKRHVQAFHIILPTSISIRSFHARPFFGSF